MGRIIRGIDPVLEEEATRLIVESLKGVTSHEAKSDILTEWKEEDRKRREIYVRSGRPDPAWNRGMYHRVLNRQSPHLNSNDGAMKGRRNKEVSTTTNAIEEV